MKIEKFEKRNRVSNGKKNHIFSCIQKAAAAMTFRGSGRWMCSIALPSTLTCRASEKQHYFSLASGASLRW